jgi:hypothetical protein
MELLCRASAAKNFVFGGLAIKAVSHSVTRLDTATNRTLVSSNRDYEYTPLAGAKKRKPQRTGLKVDP